MRWNFLPLAAFEEIHNRQTELEMAKNTMVDTVADAVVRAEIAVVRAGRQAVKVVQRGVDAGQRPPGPGVAATFDFDQHDFAPLFLGTKRVAANFRAVVDFGGK